MSILQLFGVGSLKELISTNESDPTLTVKYSLKWNPIKRFRSRVPIIYIFTILVPFSHLSASLTKPILKALKCRDHSIPPLTSSNPFLGSARRLEVVNKEVKGLMLEILEISFVD